MQMHYPLDKCMSVPYTSTMMNTETAAASAPSTNAVLCRCGKPVPPQFKSFCSRECFRANMRAESEARSQKYDLFAQIVREASAAGVKAAKECTPAPMIVEQHANPLDDSSRVTKSWYVGEGVCGFGWVTIRPGTSSFARWAVKVGGARKSYNGGVYINSPLMTQSMTRNEAWARAFADVLQSYGIRAYAQSRID